MKKLFALASLVGIAACGADTIGCSDAGTAGTSIVACTDCLSGTVTWGPDGGYAQYTEQSSLSSCRTYAHTVTPVVPYGQPPATAKACTVDLGGCDAGTPGIHDVEQALAHPDVAAALAATVPLYGTDPRPCDGAVTSIQIGGKTLLVGGECGGGGGCLAGMPCVPVPAGLRALVNALEAVDQEELALPACVQALK